jgi:type II secretory pathway component PulJ
MRSDDGHTVVELIVAMLLASMVTLGAYRAYSFAARWQESAEAAFERTTRAQVESTRERRCIQLKLAVHVIAATECPVDRSES